MPRARRDPYPNFNFAVEIDGNAVSGVSEVDLPAATISLVATVKASRREVQPSFSQAAPSSDRS